MRLNQKRLRVTIVTIFVCLMLVSALPGSASSSSSEIDFNAIDRYITDKMRPPRIPGVALAIVKGDQIVYLKGYGIAGRAELIRRITLVAVLQLTWPLVILYLHLTVINWKVFLTLVPA